MGGAQSGSGPGNETKAKTVPSPLHGEVATFLSGRDVAALLGVCHSLSASLASSERLWRQLHARDWGDDASLGDPGKRGVEDMRGYYLGREARVARWRRRAGQDRSVAYKALGWSGARALVIDAARNLLIVSVDARSLEALELPTLRSVARWQMPAEDQDAPAGLWLCGPQLAALSCNCPRRLAVWSLDSLCAIEERPRLDWCIAFPDELVVPSCLVARERAGTLVAIDPWLRGCEWSRTDGSWLRAFDLGLDRHSGDEHCLWDGRYLCVSWPDADVVLDFDAAEGPVLCPRSSVASEGRRLWRPTSFQFSLIRWWIRSWAETDECPPRQVAGVTIGECWAHRAQPLDCAAVTSIGCEVEDYLGPQLKQWVISCAASERYLAASRTDTTLTLIDLGPPQACWSPLR